MFLDPYQELFARGEISEGHTSMPEANVAVPLRVFGFLKTVKTAQRKGRQEEDLECPL